MPWRDKKTHRINKLPASLNSMSFDFNRLRSLNLQEARDSKEVVEQQTNENCFSFPLRDAKLLRFVNYKKNVKNLKWSSFLFLAEYNTWPQGCFSFVVLRPFDFLLIYFWTRVKKEQKSFVIVLYRNPFIEYFYNFGSSFTATIALRWLFGLFCLCYLNLR